MDNKMVKSVEPHPCVLNQCAMCGNWSNYTDHIKNNPIWFENIWDEPDVHHMWGSDTFSIITMHNMTKPFVCVDCMVMESGSI